MKKLDVFVVAVGVALCAATLVAGPDTKNLGPSARGNFMPEDFEESRPDGRYENNLAWAHDMVRNMTPIYSLDKVKNPDAMTSYLHAIVAARRGNKFAAESYLKEALQLDPSLKAYADKDLELTLIK